MRTILLTLTILMLVGLPPMAAEDKTADEQAASADTAEELLNVCGTISVDEVPAVSKASVCLNAGRLTLSAGPSFDYELQKEVGSLEDDGYTLRTYLNVFGGVTTSVAVEDFSIDTMTFGAFVEANGEAVAKIKDFGNVTGSLFGRVEINNDGFDSTFGVKASKELASF